MSRHVPVVPVTHAGGLSESLTAALLYKSLLSSVSYLKSFKLIITMCIEMTTNKRILGVLGNGPTRRNLFGPVDREQLRAEYQTALRKDLEEASRRWGFDFMSDKPLESSEFQWEGVPGARVPLLYRSCTNGLEQLDGQRAASVSATPKRRRVESPRRQKENIPGSPERCALNTEKLEKTPMKRENTGLKRKQTNITDFYQAKRRVVGMPRKSGE